MCLSVCVCVCVCVFISRCCIFLLSLSLCPCSKSCVTKTGTCRRSTTVCTPSARWGRRLVTSWTTRTGELTSIIQCLCVCDLFCWLLPMLFVLELGTCVKLGVGPCVKLGMGTLCLWKWVPVYIESVSSWCMCLASQHTLLPPLCRLCLV